MNSLYLTNSLTKKKKYLIQLIKKNFFICLWTSTVYDKPHVGNARALVIFDLLYRVLIELYGKR